MFQINIGGIKKYERKWKMKGSGDGLGKSLIRSEFYFSSLNLSHFFAYYK